MSRVIIQNKITRSWNTACVEWNYGHSPGWTVVTSQLFEHPIQVSSVQGVEHWHEGRVCMRTGVATVTLVSSTDQNTPLSTSTVAVAAAGSVVYRQQMALPPTQKPNPVTAVTERTFKLASKLQAHGELFNWSVADVQCIVSPRLNTRIIAGTLQSYYQKFLFSTVYKKIVNSVLDHVIISSLHR